MANNEQNKWKSVWTSTRTNVDIETGEQISNEERNNNYIIIKKHRQYEQSKLGSGGIIKYTYVCRKLKFKQTELPFNRT